MKKLKFLILGLVIISSATFTACGKAAPNTVQNSKEAMVNDMSGEDLNKIMEDDKEKENYLVIDVRAAEEYAAGHVKHAININVDDLEKNIGKIEDFKEKNVVTVCNTGKKSKKAADILIKNGFKKVFNAKGVKEFKYDTITRVNNIRGNDFDNILKTADKSKIYIIDARNEKDYNEGHIENAVLMNAKEIDKNFSSVPKDKKIYAYCYVGTRSYKIADVLSKNGYDATNVLDGTNEYKNFSLVK